MALKSTCTFALGGSSVTIRGVDQSTDIAILPQWVTSLSMGLTRWSYRGADRALRRWSLRFGSLTASDKSGLENFFLTVVGGPGVAFTYTHTDGSSYSAQFAQSGLQWRRYSSALWEVSLTLEVP